MSVSKMTTILAASRDFFITLTYKKTKDTLTEAIIEISPAVERSKIAKKIVEALFHILILSPSEKERHFQYLEQFINASDTNNTRKFWDNLNPMALKPLVERDIAVTVLLTGIDGSLLNTTIRPAEHLFSSMQYLEKELFFRAFHIKNKETHKKLKSSLHHEHEHKRLTHKYFLHHTI